MFSFPWPCKLVVLAELQLADSLYKCAPAITQYDIKEINSACSALCFWRIAWSVWPQCWYPLPGHAFWVQWIIYCPAAWLVRAEQCIPLSAAGLLPPVSAKWWISVCVPWGMEEQCNPCGLLCIALPTSLVIKLPLGEAGKYSQLHIHPLSAAKASEGAVCK